MRRYLFPLITAIALLEALVLVWQSFSLSVEMRNNSAYTEEDGGLSPDGPQISQGPDVQKPANSSSAQTASPSLVVKVPYLAYTFNVPGVLQEAGSFEESSSPYWWLDSGGVLAIENGYGATNEGSLPALSRWRLLYNVTNPLDTDNGYHPQNIFRLVTQDSWKEIWQQAYFTITANELSDSPNRNASNGLLLFNRYESAATLYYTGIRVDGALVIKKKIDGVYYTLAYKQIFPGTYDRAKNPNLLPLNQWIGLRSEVSTNVDGTVTIKLYTDLNHAGDWTLALSATDDGKSFGGRALTKAGHAGIRTDFMDVRFSAYKVGER